MVDPTAPRFVVDIRTPEGWKASGFWRLRRRRVFGIVVAFSPRFFGIGVEVIRGYGTGAALIVGPFWIGGVTAAAEGRDDG